MTDTEIGTEISKRQAGAKSNKCLLGCGRRTSSQDMFHTECWNFGVDGKGFDIVANRRINALVIESKYTTPAFNTSPGLMATAARDANREPVSIVIISPVRVAAQTQTASKPQIQVNMTQAEARSSMKAWNPTDRLTEDQVRERVQIVKIANS